MSLLDAPVYDEKKARTIKYAVIGSLALFALLVVLTVVGYILGHGWLFSNLPAEHRVGSFFQALEDKKYDQAFAIYNNDPDWKQHPDKYASYPESRFQEDWTTQDPIKGPVNQYHVDISKTDGKGTFGSSTIVAVTVNGDKRVFMSYIKKTGQLSWPAFHILEY